MLQQYVASEDTQQFDGRVRPYVAQVLMVIFIFIFIFILLHFNQTIVRFGQFNHQVCQIAI